MFGSPPPDESKPKIDRYISNLSGQIAALDKLRKELGDQKPRPDNFKKFDTEIRNHLINLTNTQALLKEAKEPGFFAWLRRGEKILEIQFEPEKSNTTASIHAAEALATQVRTAMQQHNHAPQKHAGVITVSSREQGRGDPQTILAGLEKEIMQFYEQKLKDRVPEDYRDFKPDASNAHMIQYDDTDLRGKIRQYATNIDKCISTLNPEQKSKFAENIERLQEMKQVMNSAHGIISNLDTKPAAAIEVQEARRPGMGKH